MQRIRAFVSYSPEDRELGTQVVKTLADLGLNPVTEDRIRPGSPFTDAIKTKITDTNLFVPLITDVAARRPWVYQEIGYAMGQGVPVLPLATASIPGEMIWSLEAITLGETPSAAEIKACLENVDFDGIMSSPPEPPEG